LILANVIERSFCEAKYSKAHSVGMSPIFPWGHEERDGEAISFFYEIGLTAQSP